MENMGIISRPQFDMNEFIPGTPIFVNAPEGNNEWYDFAEYCLVQKATPLKLTVIFIDSDQDSKEREITIGQVVDGPVCLSAVQIKPAGRGL